LMHSNAVRNAHPGHCVGLVEDVVAIGGYQHTVHHILGARE
jgi:hypothetical protein